MFSSLRRAASEPELVNTWQSFETGAMPHIDSLFRIAMWCVRDRTSSERPQIAPGATPDAADMTSRDFKHDQGAKVSSLNVGDDLAIERISELDIQFPDLLKRHKLAHDAIFVVGCAILVFLCDMFLISSAVVLGSVWTATGTLILFLIGAGIVFAGTLLMTLEVRTSHLALHYEVRRVMSLGKKQQT